MQEQTDFDVFRAGQSEYLTVFVKDPRTGVLTDVVANSTFSLIKIDDDSTVLSETFGPAGGTLVTRQATGIYQFLLNTATYDDEYLATFRCVLTGEVLGINFFVKSVSTRHFKYAAILRSQVDKSRKSIVDYIENIDRPNESPINFNLGYADKMLIFALERGVQVLNAVPPYTSLIVDNFPFDQYGAILIDAATIAALEAQGIFAIDTDFDYALGGNSLVIDHFSKLSTMVSNILTRFNVAVIKFKNIYLSQPLILHQILPHAAMRGRLYRSLPSGFWSRFYSGF